jgi:hypothetical protein
VTLQYDASEADIVLANQELAVTPEGKQLWQRLRRFRMVVGGVVGAMTWALSSLPLLWLPLYVIGCVLLLGVFLDSALRRNDIRMTIRRLVKDSKGKGIVGERRMTLTPEGLVVVSETGSQTVFWSALEKLLETPSFLLFQRSERDYVLLPKRVFTTPQHQAAFLAAVERFRQGQAQSGAEPLKQTQAWYQSKDQVG